MSDISELSEFSPQSQIIQAEELATVTNIRPHDEGVFSVEQKYYGAFDPHAENIGHLKVVETRFSGGRGECDPLREHNLMTVDIDDYRHVLWVTEPLHRQTDTLNVVSKPGWFEVVQDGIGWQIHKNLAKRLPETRVVSHATHGIGPHADMVTWAELPAHGLGQMAEEGLELLQAYLPHERIVMVGTSMGSVINNRLLQLNLVSEQPLNVVGNVNVAVALVDPNRVLQDMGLRFGYEITKDIVGEILTRTNPRHILGWLSILGHSRMRARDLPTIARQGLGLLAGTPIEDIERVTAAYPTAVIAGEKDPVAEIPMWQEFEKKYPGLLLKIVKKRGHGIATKPIESSRKIGKTIGEMGLYPLPEAA